MGSGQADRTILFKLRVADDNANDTALKQFGDRIQQTYRNARQAGSGSTSTSAAGSRSAALRNEVQAEKKAALDIAAIRREAGNRYAPNQATRQAVAASAATVRLEEKIADGKERNAAKTKMLLERETKERERSLSRQEAAAFKAEKLNLRLASSLVSVGQSAVGAARGIALMGLAGEENTQKLLTGILAIEGATGLARSGMGAYKKIGTSLLLARKSVAGGVAGWAAKGLVGAATLAPPMAAAAGVGAAAYSAVNFANDVRNYGFMGGSKVGSASDTVGGYAARGLGWLSGLRKPAAWLAENTRGIPGIGVATSAASMAANLLGMSSFGQAEGSRQRVERIQAKRTADQEDQRRTILMTAPSFEHFARVRAIERSGRFQQLEAVTQNRSAVDMQYRTPEDQTQHDLRLKAEELRNKIGGMFPEFRGSKAEYTRLSEAQDAGQTVNLAALQSAQNRYATNLQIMADLYGQQKSTVQALAATERDAAEKIAQSVERRSQSYSSQRQGIWDEMRSVSERRGGMSESEKHMNDLSVKHMKSGEFMTPEMEDNVIQNGTRSEREQMRKIRRQRGEADLRRQGRLNSYDEQAASTMEMDPARRNASKDRKPGEVGVDLAVQINGNEELQVRLINAAMQGYIEQLLPRLEKVAGDAYRQNAGLAIQRLETQRSVKELVGNVGQ